MLKGIDPLLLVDRNYPAAATGKPVIRLGEVIILRAAQAILSVLPLDHFLEHPLERMEVDGDQSKTTPTQDALLAQTTAAEGRPLVYGVIHTLDTAPYGCFILHKGVIFT